VNTRTPEGQIDIIREHLEPRKLLGVNRDFIPGLDWLEHMSESDRATIASLIDAGRLAEAVGRMLTVVAVEQIANAGRLMAGKRSASDTKAKLNAISWLVAAEIDGGRLAAWPKPQAAMLERFTGKRGKDRPVLNAWPNRKLMVQLLVADGVSLRSAEKAVESWPHKDARGRIRKP